MEIEESGQRVPKIIWFLWFQGLDNAPYVVRKCHESWVTKNPGWQVVTLDDTTVPTVASRDYYAGSLATITRQHRADLLRLDLLAHHGGVWADATTFCVQPLDSWLPPDLVSGFFAFHRPRPERIISNWFLAAEPGNPVVSKLLEAMLAHWGRHPFRANRQSFLERAFTKALRGSARTRKLWFTPPLRDWLRISPYYAFSYRLEKLVREDPDCRRVWERTPKVSAEAPHRLYRAGLLAPASAAIQSEIDGRVVPVYKTAWNLRSQDIPADSILGYLLDGRPSEAGERR